MHDLNTGKHHALAIACSVYRVNVVEEMTKYDWKAVRLVDGFTSQSQKKAIFFYFFFIFF